MKKVNIAIATAIILSVTLFVPEASAIRKLGFWDPIVDFSHKVQKFKEKVEEKYTAVLEKQNEKIKNSGYSHSRFAELFKKHVGISLVEYMINKRLNYAADLLSTTNKSTLEISSLVGYDSYSCFVRLFKKQFNVSPIQYRQHNSRY